jgi:hypothetical protein
MPLGRSLVAVLALFALAALAPPLPAEAEPPATAEPIEVALARLPVEARATVLEPTISEPSLFDRLRLAAADLDGTVLERALGAHQCAVSRGDVQRPEILTVIDYSLPSTSQRMWIFDLDRRELLYHERVAHGKNSGNDRADRFSNVPGSLQTSLGLFVTDATYDGRHGYSLRLQGLEPGINDRAFERAIVVHGAEYVSDETVASLGRLGRSWGCPAVRPAVARELIDTIKGGSAIYAFYPDDEWLGSSRFSAACR